MVGYGGRKKKTGWLFSMAFCCYIKNNPSFPELSSQTKAFEEEELQKAQSNLQTFTPHSSTTRILG